mmetsp:Transcript_73287/g.158969  ORF Transcript_73287/g.158969 Transcript_73287/m.158969 type:complete len:317 (-) Transcript_73287:99-1049(-)
MKATGNGSDGDRPGRSSASREAEVDSEEEREEQEENDYPPSYPFPCDMRLELGAEEHIQVCRHLCRQHPGGTQSIAVFLPGVHGGVGPCRQPGETFDEAALYPLLAARLSEEHAIDAYRCSWPFMRPRMRYAVAAACSVLHYAIREAAKEKRPSEAAEKDGAQVNVAKGAAGDRRTIRVFFVGHSLGGAVAVHAAEAVARHLSAGAGGVFDRLHAVDLELGGICTLNCAIDVQRHQQAAPEAKLFSALGKSCGFFICGDADEVVPPEATEQLHEVMPMQRKRLLVLQDGTHDLFAHKAQLLEEIAAFITEDPSEGI